MDKTAAQIGYEAYGESCLPVPWKTWDGNPMPTWSELTPEVQRRWAAAASAIQAALSTTANVTADSDSLRTAVVDTFRALTDRIAT